MIRRGRAEGWLSRPPTELVAWAQLNGCAFHNVKFDYIQGREERGCAVIATRALDGLAEEPLVVVPRNLILSKERVQQQARIDPSLRAVYDALGEFGSSSRIAIMAFLLHQVSIANPGIPGSCGMLNPFTDYVKFLPSELLPTFWYDDEIEILTGTTLRAALDAKKNSLSREFETLKSLTAGVSWCAEHWWDEDSGFLSFDDWLQVDAIWRSRALEYPGIGDAMAPCIDMANHEAGEMTAALYETDENGDSILFMRDGKHPQAGEEITITYGDNKGACEMLFSYGFIDDSMRSAKELFLNLEMQEDDPLAPAKVHVATAPPGVKIYETQDGSTRWESDFIWLIILNEEDGLGFRVLQTVDGQRELAVLWKGESFEGTEKLREKCEQDALWPVFRLRAVALIKGRVDAQIQRLHDTRSLERASHGAGTAIRNRPFSLAIRLRALELRLLLQAQESLNDQMNELLASEVVQKYLAESSPEDAEEEDFT